MLRHGGRVGFGGIAGKLDRLLHLRLDPLLDGIDLRLVCQALAQQPVVAHHADRVPPGPGIDFFLGTVATHDGVPLVVGHDAVGLDLEQRGQALHREAEHRAADVVRVVVRAERADDAHVVLLGDAHEVAHVPGGIDDETLPGHAVPEQVHEVLHALRGGVVAREVAPAQELTNVEP